MAQGGLGYGSMSAIYIPPDGSDGQRLTKQTDNDYDYDWEDGVNSGNPNNVIYVKGDADTDGSLRFVPDTIHGGEHVEVQIRVDGVWNATGFDVTGEPSLNLGSANELGAGGTHLRTLAEAAGTEHMLPHIHYDPDLGSVEACDVPVLGAKITRFVIQPDNSGEFIGNSISWTTTSPVGSAFMGVARYFQVTQDATDDVVYTARADDENGDILLQITLPASLFVVGELSFDFPGWQEVFGETTTWAELSVANSGTVGIAMDVTNTTPWGALDTHVHDHQHLAPMEFTNDAMVTDSLSFELVLDTDGNTIFEEPTIRWDS